MPEPSPINDLLSDLVQPDEVDRFSDPVEARKKAMDYLARREHSRDELMKKLEKAGFDGNVALDAIEALKAEGLQSDRRFVEAFVQSNVRKGKGPARIRASLRERGIREPLVDAVLTELDTDWAALAIEVHRRKFGDELPVDFKEKARQMRFLQYRGFESEQIQAAVSGTD
ncbi:MAG: regulatory protein RecX [Woeseiaceae bacterium]|nr:regulatory protein RecX [Woeseiaceae bacterium]